MKLNTRAYTPGLMALASGEMARYAHCRSSIEGMIRPATTRRYSATCLSVAENFNAAADVLLSMPDLQWLLLMNDDHMFDETTLVKLLDRMIDEKLDAVTALYVERNFPFGPVLYEASTTDVGKYTRRFLRASDHETITVDACGDGCMLVQRRVIEALHKAHEGVIWELGYGSERAMKAQSNHDIAFCSKLRAAGFTITADLAVRLGHTTSMTIYPRRDDDGTWGIECRPRADRRQAFTFGAPTGDEPV